MTFQDTLHRLHRSRLIGRLLLVALILVVILGLAMLAHGLADYHWALDSGKRRAINGLILVMLGLGGSCWLFKIFSTPKSDTAALADATLGDERGRSLSATYLAALEADTPMKQFHLDRSLSEAEEKLKTLPFLACIPTKAIALSAIVILTVLGIILGLKKAQPVPFEVVSQRIFNPSGDTPPYSPLFFTVTPDHPQAIYQGEAIVHVQISGGEIENDVFCLIKDPSTGRIEQTTTFREKPTKFARKFEHTLEPVEFAFATGRARSAWHTLDVLFQPRISATRVTITPPVYTGQASQGFPLESGEIKALEGSKISLSIESNRPLSTGMLTLAAMDQNESRAPEEIVAELTGEKELTFSWTAHRSSKLSALIRDIRSTKAKKPLELIVKTVPDQAPLVTISEPQSVVLATPRSRIPMVGEIEDDHGLAKVSLTRTLVGYRDRTKPVAEGLEKKSFDYTEGLELESLGVEPGQMLEFYLEAADRNPSLLGIGVSDVVRVQIISEDDYAERIRAQFQLKQFTARYNELARAIQESRDALNALKNSKNKEEFEKSREAAAEAHERAEELARQLANDFKAFDMEERLQQTAQKTADTLKENLDALKNLPLDATVADIEKLQERLGGVQEEAQALQQDAELVRKLGAVLEMAAQYKRLLEDQRSIVTRLEDVAKQIALGNTGNATRLEGLARVQERNRQELLKFAAELRARADVLPEEVQEMKDDVDEFLESLEEMDIPNPMQASSDASNNGDSMDALSHANFALKLMERLLEKPKNGF